MATAEVWASGLSWWKKFVCSAYVAVFRNFCIQLVKEWCIICSCNGFSFFKIINWYNFMAILENSRNHFHSRRNNLCLSWSWISLCGHSFDYYLIVSGVYWCIQVSSTVINQHQNSDLLCLNCEKRVLEICIQNRCWSNMSKTGTQRAACFLMPKSWFGMWQHILSLCYFSNFNSTVIQHYLLNLSDVFISC